MASDNLPPPSYATRPPPGHRSGPSNKKSYKRATNLDSEDDDGQISETAQPLRPNGNVARPGEYDESQADFSNDEELNEEVSDDEKYSAEGKGKSRRTRYPDESDEGRNPTREDFSRALMHPKDTRLDKRVDRRSGRDTDRRRSRDRETGDDGSDYGGDRRHVRGHERGSQALARTRDKPRDLREIARHRGRGEEEDDKMIPVKRFSNIHHQEINPQALHAILSIFVGISYDDIKFYCDIGKIRFDETNKELCLDGIYSMFPPYMAARFELAKEESRILEEEDSRHGRRPIVQTVLVPVYDEYETVYDLDYLYWMR